RWAFLDLRLLVVMLTYLLYEMAGVEHQPALACIRDAICFFGDRTRTRPALHARNEKISPGTSLSQESGNRPSFQVRLCRRVHRGSLRRWNGLDSNHSAKVHRPQPAQVEVQKKSIQQAQL